MNKCSEVYNGGIGVTAGVMMLKWNMMDNYINTSDLNIVAGDKINVFISLESVMKNVIRYKNADILSFNHKQKFVIELESAILNLVANYKSYFARIKCNAKIYLYCTDISSDHYYMKNDNKFYRDYYTNIYNNNPKYNNVGNTLRDIIIPEIQLILSYVENCYLVVSTNIDGSIIPLMIDDGASKNILITSDLFDTLYMFQGNFMVIYIRRSYSDVNICTTASEVIRALGIDDELVGLFSTEMYFRLLLSVYGDTHRNIKPMNGFGMTKFIKCIKGGINDNIVLGEYRSILSLIGVFPEKYINCITSAFNSTDIESQLSMIPDVDIEKIKDSMKDVIDQESLEALNNKRFYEFPISLQSLI